MCISTLPRDVGSVTTADSPTSKVWPQGAVSTGNVLGFGDSLKVIYCRKTVNLFPCLLHFQNSAQDNTCIYK